MTSRDDGPQRMRVDRRTFTLVQTPFVHVLPPAHTFPQEPQLLLSELVFTHELPHFVSPPAQKSVHTPFEQT
jgi:hypothetical protein